MTFLRSDDCGLLRQQSAVASISHRRLAKGQRAGRANAHLREPLTEELTAVDAGGATHDHAVRVREDLTGNDGRGRAHVDLDPGRIVVNPAVVDRCRSAGRNVHTRELLVVRDLAVVEDDPRPLPRHDAVLRAAPQPAAQDRRGRAHVEHDVRIVMREELGVADSDHRRCVRHEPVTPMLVDLRRQDVETRRLVDRHTAVGVGEITALECKTTSGEQDTHRLRGLAADRDVTQIDVAVNDTECCARGPLHDDARTTAGQRDRRADVNVLAIDAFGDDDLGPRRRRVHGRLQRSVRVGVVRRDFECPAVPPPSVRHVAPLGFAEPGQGHTFYLPCRPQARSPPKPVPGMARRSS